MRNNTLVRRIGSGYALLIILLACAVGITIIQVSRIRVACDRLDTVRLPAVQSGIEITNGANHSSAALRGWVFLRNASFKSEYEQAWAEQIEAPLQRLDTVLERDTLGRERLAEIHKAIKDFRREEETALNSTLEQAEPVVSKRSGPALAALRVVLNNFTDEQKALMRSDLDDIHAKIALLNELEWVLLLIGMVAGIILAVAVTRSISGPVNKAVAVADNIAGGDLGTEVDVGGSRELSILGAALRSMRDSLRKREAEGRRYAWLTDGQRKLDEVMRGEKSITQLADDMMASLAEHAGAHIGAFYTLDDNGQHLRLTGRYAIDPDTPTVFEVGSGLVGQAVLDREIRLIDQVDPGHVRVLSSFVSGPPAAFLIAPVLLDGRVTGVIELGTLTRFDESHLEYLHAILPSMGVAMNVASNRERIGELLEETQRQGEELQVQQEELQQSNEELEEQSERLKVQQEELQVTNEELEERAQAMEEQNHALASARRDVELKAEQLAVTSKYKSEFLANMSHELRTPLNSLLILSNHLARNKHGNLDKDQVESAQVIAKSGNDLLRLINDILDLSKVEAGKMDIEIVRISVAGLAEELRSSFTHMAKEKGLAFQVRTMDGAPEFVWSDAQRIGQVLKNLISNALKFTAHGSVEVSIAAEGTSEWSIAVADSGIGIPADKQRLIFEAFQQAEGGTSRQYGGTGLGLSIAREMSKLLGGRITLQSVEGQGATFTLTLPLRGSATAAQPSMPQPAAAPTPEGKYIGYPTIADQRQEIMPEDHVVLIIEDDRSFAQVLAHQANARGFKFLAAATGEDGLALVRQYGPHAVILDLSLPGMDGLSVLKELKNDPQLRHIPVHIMSVNERTLEPIRSGAVEFLVKPVTQDQLDGAFARIADLVDRKMKNLLIVEDDPDQRMAIMKLIGNGDVRCLEAGSIAEALDLCDNNAVDCIVLDIGLPDGNGSLLLEKLKERMGPSLPPIIIYTGKELTRQENDALRQYAETIIVKDIRSEERLLDETALFLHRTIKDLPPTKQAMIMDQYDPETLFKGRTVLLVDDDMRNVFALSKVLVGKGLNVLRAENGRVALDILERGSTVDLVLMDIMMPEMDGYACMREIRRQDRFEHLPIIALTAKAMKEDRQKCIDAGANDYTTKPVDAERLFSLMRIWIERNKS
jgi:CheY-like chemotaxis protein/signal transduction histidine kinase/HAMP domain-containing protein